MSSSQYHRFDRAMTLMNHISGAELKATDTSANANVAALFDASSQCPAPFGEQAMWGFCVMVALNKGASQHSCTTIGGKGFHVCAEYTGLDGRRAALALSEEADRLYGVLKTAKGRLREVAGSPRAKADNTQFRNVLALVYVEIWNGLCADGYTVEMYRRCPALRASRLTAALKALLGVAAHQLPAAFAYLSHKLPNEYAFTALVHQAFSTANQHVASPCDLTCTFCSSGHALNMAGSSSGGGGGGGGVSMSSSSSSSLSLGGLPSMEQIQLMTDIGEVEQWLLVLGRAEVAVDESLTALLKGEPEVAASVESLIAIKPKVYLGGKEASRLLSVVSETSTAAQTVSGRIRQLDRAQSRVSEALEKVSGILSLKSTMESLEQAIAQEGYEAAVEHIKIYASFSEDVLEETSRESRQRLAEQLKAMVRSKFQEAAAAGNDDEVARFASLYAPLDMADEGLASVVTFKRSALRKTFSVHLNALTTDPSTELSFVGVLTDLYDEAAWMVESDVPEVSTWFGVSGALELVLGLRAEVNELGRSLVTEFEKARGTKKMVKLAAQNRGNNADKRAETLDLDGLLYELGLISERTARYESFMAKTLVEAESAVAAAGSISPLTSTVGGHKGGSGGGGLEARVQELMSDYIALEHAFLQESIKKAIANESADAKDLLTTLVDDVFYLIHKSMRRSVSTCNISAVCAMLNNVATELSETLTDRFKNKLIEKGVGPNKTLKSGYGQAINVIGQASIFVVKLCDQIEAEAASKFTAAHDRELLQATLPVVKDCKEKFDTLLHRSIKSVAQTVSDQLEKKTSAILNVNYELTETEFNTNEMHDPFVRMLIEDLDALIRPFKANLLETHFDSLLHILIDVFVKALEGQIPSKRFNQFGALQFDKDIRALVSFFSQLTTTTVRDKFSRLSQMSTLLNIEKPSDAVEYWRTMSWKLRPDEAKRVLQQRKDFKANAFKDIELN